MSGSIGTIPFDAAVHFMDTAEQNEQWVEYYTVEWLTLLVQTDAAKACSKKEREAETKRPMGSKLSDFEYIGFQAPTNPKIVWDEKIVSNFFFCFYYCI